MENALAVRKYAKPRTMTIVKIVLDALMAVVFILLMDPKAISMAFHEIAGLIIGGVFLIHKLLNWKWIKNVTRNIFGRQVTAETRIRYIVDVLLFIGVYLIIISGALISEYVFPNAAGGGDWTTAHHIAAYLCIPLLGFHAGLHVKWMKNAFRKMIKMTRESKARQWVLRTASMAMAVWGIVSAVTSGFIDRIFPVGGENMTQIKTADLYSAESGMSSGTSSAPSSGTASSGASESSADESASVSPEPSSDISSDNSASAGNGSGSDETVTENSGTTATITLEEFLSKLTCTGCHKHCSLLSPQCGVGVRQQQEAIAEYESQYGDTASVEPTVYTQAGGNYLQVGTAVYTLNESSGSVAQAVTLSAQTEQTEQSASDAESPGAGQQHSWGKGSNDGEDNEYSDESESSDEIESGCETNDTINSGSETNGIIADGDSAGIESMNVLYTAGLDDQPSGFTDTLLTYAPVMWLFGVVGWAVSLLAGRKEKRRTPKRQITVHIDRRGL